MSLFPVVDPNNCLRDGDKSSKNIYLFKILKIEIVIVLLILKYTTIINTYIIFMRDSHKI